MSTIVSPAPPLHDWHYGHVGEHPNYGIVTVFDIELTTDARIITFINAKGEQHQQRDNGRNKLGVRFLHDSGHVIGNDGENLYVGPYVDAFAAGLFDEPAEQAATAPVPAKDPAPQDTTRVNHLLYDLQLKNPEAMARIEPDQRNPESDSRMIRLVGTGLDLMPIMDPRKYELVVEYFRATRSEANAVIIVICKPLDR